jgi:LDH2 family malate/lactate/ureidoglycolate dehydrogenase
MPAPYERHRAQLKAILLAWGMPEDNAEVTADILGWADLHGVDSHGISMIPGYDRARRSGRAKMAVHPRIVKETAVSALIDGGGGLGHVPARFAMQVAIDKAKEAGIAITAVRNSAHFGATGYYALMAAEAGLIGMACTSNSVAQVAPTFGKEAKLGTDPWSFAAPTAEPGRPFLLDMATTTVAAGRIRNKANEGLPCPPGWVLDKEGRPSTDPAEAREKGGFLTSLGGAPETSSYKGYGLAVMVNILSACLSGATLITDPLSGKPEGNGIGHCFIAIDPALFRDTDDFTADVTRLCNDLRATTPMDPAQRVMVAGDPQWNYAKERLEKGIPVGAGLLNQIRQVAQACAAPWLLD